MKLKKSFTSFRLIPSGRRLSLLKATALVLSLLAVLFYSRFHELIRNNIIVAKFKDLKISRNVIAGESDIPSESLSSSYHFVHVNSRTPVTDQNAAFLVILPFSDKNDKNISMKINENDKLSLDHLKNFLGAMNEFDGATCLQQSLLPEKRNEDKTVTDERNASLLSSWCSFLKRDWSVHIRNTGPTHRLYLEQTIMGDMRYSPEKFSGADVVELQICNIVQGPFVIRKNVFREIGGLLDGFGRVTLLEFFLRSKGKLKIAKLENCMWTPQITRMDRGTLEGSNNISEYATLGNKHKILRIIEPGRIEWTTCAANWKLCKEKPYVKPRGLPGIALPICCSAVLSEMLADFKQAFNRLGIEYTVTFGTLLGAVRSKAIIPYTRDVDIGLPRATFTNTSTYAALQRELNGKFFVGTSFKSLYRAHMIPPPHLVVDTDLYYSGPNDLKGDAFFSPRIEKAVKGLLPIPTRWRSRPYVDFYKNRNENANETSFVSIDKQNYPAAKDAHKFLRSWYGNYMEPSVKGRWYKLSDRKTPPI